MESKVLCVRTDDCIVKLKVFLKLGVKGLKVEIDDKIIDGVLDAIAEVAGHTQIELHIDDPTLRRMAIGAAAGGGCGLIMVLISGNPVWIPVGIAVGAMIAAAPSLRVTVSRGPNGNPVLTTV